MENSGDRGERATVEIFSLYNGNGGSQVFFAYCAITDNDRRVKTDSILFKGNLDKVLACDADFLRQITKGVHSQFSPPIAENQSEITVYIGSHSVHRATFHDTSSDDSFSGGINHLSGHLLLGIQLHSE